MQGTVLMVLRKQATADTAFLDEVVPEVEAEVERQLASMRDLDDRDAPNFSDADYQLAAYAAALRVLTSYRAIEDVDVSYELARERQRGEANPLARIIADAVRTASNFLVPVGLPAHVWRGLAAEEKLYLKGLEVETHGDFRAGVYQEFARGFRRSRLPSPAAHRQGQPDPPEDRLRARARRPGRPGHRPPRPLRRLANRGDRRRNRQPHVAAHRTRRLLAAARGPHRHPPLSRRSRRRPLACGC